MFVAKTHKILIFNKMTIQEIKDGLDIIDLGEHLGLEIDKKTKKARCFNHNDKTPSLQFSRDKQICTCFGSGCNLGTQDVIGLTEKYLGLTTHEALKYLETTFFVSDGHEEIWETKKLERVLSKQEDYEGEEVKVNFRDLQEKSQRLDYGKDFEQMQSSYLSSSLAKKYAAERNLEANKLELGYNAYKSSKFDYLRGCLIFPLKNKTGHAVSLYGRSVQSKSKSKHFYTKNLQGLYPSYPKPETKRLILTESVIDAATLLSLEEPLDYEILALYGGNGFTVEHEQAIKPLSNLEEIILFLDGDLPGQTASNKYAKRLSLETGKKVSIVQTPEGTDINELSQSHTHSVFNQLLSERVEISRVQQEVKTVRDIQLDLTKGNRILYNTQTASYQIKGGIKKDLDSLKITLEIKNPETQKSFCDKVELYEYKQLEKYCRTAAEKLGLRSDLLELDLTGLIELLDKYREDKKNSEVTELDVPRLTSGEKVELIKFGKQKNLMGAINGLIGKSGVVGESDNRQFLFVVAVSHLMKKPLQVVVQGGSGSGKSYLIKKVSYLVPQKRVRRYTRLSEKSFYNFGEYDLCNCLIIIEDYDGMNEEVEYAFRELQSNEVLVSAVSGKEFENSEIQTKDKIVRGPIASMVATTKGEIYHDNSTRVFFISIDESPEQTQKIIDYKNKKANGEIKESEEKQSEHYLQNFVSTLRPYKVRNPYLKQITLPVPHKELRRLHELLESFCTQIVLIHQHQREKTATGELVATKHDMELAVRLMFDSIVLKVDELNGRLRQFYEELKQYVKKQGKDYEFIQREIRHELEVSKSQLQRHMYQLEEYEYIQKRGLGSSGANRYKIIYWDDNEALRLRIKKDLEHQLKNLK